MTATDILMQRQAIALQRGAEVARELAPLDVPLRNAVDEPFPNDVYILAEVVNVLGRVCVQQRAHIIELAERIEALEGRLSEAAAEK
jgi:hypothetical protein